MSGKKALYRPAPEESVPSPLKTLPQGDISSTARIAPVPKIKQGILDKTSAEKSSGGTLKTSKKSGGSVKPVVVCHNPHVVHSYIKAGDGLSKELAQDTVSVPQVVVIPPDTAKKQNSSLQSTVVKPKSLSRKEHYVQSRYRNTSASASRSSKMDLSSNRKPGRPRPDFSGSYSAKIPAEKRNPGKTSTPTAAVTNHPSFDWNASAIEKNQSSVHAVQEDTFNNQENTPKSGVIDESELELMYSRYIQWHYMKIKCQAAAEERSEQAAAELKFMLEKKRRLQKEVDGLEQKDKMLQHQIDLEKQLELQKSALGPIIDKLDTGIDQYTTLVANLDTTRHNLPLEGIADPDPDELANALDEARNLLGQINILTHSQAPAIETMCVSTRTLHGHCSEEADVTPVVKGMVEEELSMTLKQASLVSQLQS